LKGVRGKLFLEKVFLENFIELTLKQKKRGIRSTFFAFRLKRIREKPFSEKDFSRETTY